MPPPMIKVAQANATFPYRAPSRSYEQDCGFDLYCSRETLVPAQTHADIPHNICVQLPPDTWGWLTSRSSTMRNKGLVVIGGVIDGGYRGEVFTQVFNPTREDSVVKYNDRISQLIIMPLIAPAIVGVDKLDDTDRGNRGFGSSDRSGEVLPNEPEIDVGRGPRPKIICLSGSTRYWKEFARINTELTIRGYIVLSIGSPNMPDEEAFSHLNQKEWEEQKKRLDELHFHKIAMCDELLVLNIGGYIGQSTRNEIQFATRLGKMIGYLYPSLGPNPP